MRSSQSGSCVSQTCAVGDSRAQVYCYEPSWHHGNAVVEWPL